MVVTVQNSDHLTGFPYHLLKDSKMKIQLGSITMNKTKKYLLPCLKAYGKEFEKHVTSVFKVAVGVGDMMLIKSGVHYEKHIFILVDTSRFHPQLKACLEWLREQPMYEDEYAYDSVHNGHLQMLVIKLPESCYKAKEWFMHSQFSKMYNMQDVEKYFKKNEMKGVLIKDHNYRLQYTKELNRLYGTTLTEKDADEISGEIDFPIQQEDETFGIDSLITIDDNGNPTTGVHSGSSTKA